MFRFFGSQIYSVLSKAQLHLDMVHNIIFWSANGLNVSIYSCLNQDGHLSVTALATVLYSVVNSVSVSDNFSRWQITTWWWSRLSGGTRTRLSHCIPCEMKQLDISWSKTNLVLCLNLTKQYTSFSEPHHVISMPKLNQSYTSCVLGLPLSLHVAGQDTK